MTKSKEEFVRLSRESLMRERARVEAEYARDLAKLNADLGYLQQICGHPEMSQCSVMGKEIDYVCPDCGWRL